MQRFRVISLEFWELSVQVKIYAVRELFAEIFAFYLHSVNKLTYIYTVLTKLLFNDKF